MGGAGDNHADLWFAAPVRSSIYLASCLFIKVRRLTLVTWRSCRSGLSNNCRKMCLQ